MKNIIRTFIVISFLATFPLVTICQTTDPGNPGGSPTGPPVGGGAPIGSGLVMLLGMGIAYGSKKVYDLNKKELDD